MQPKKIISGLDVMKFLMAFLIVDIHVHGSAITPPHFAGICNSSH